MPTKTTRTALAVTHNVRATFYPNPDGSMTLARVQSFTGAPRFREVGYEDLMIRDTPAPDLPPEIAEEAFDLGEYDKPGANPENVARATRRARLLAYDLIKCNPDLDGFATLTFSPDEVDDKASYADCYRRLRVWLSNGVQRDGLKYICVPELTKAGDVHFHAIANMDALRVEAAINPHNGRVVRHHGDPVYNLTNFPAGFSTVQRVRRRAGDDDPREAVARYIFKYMTKNAGAKIGGRYVLKGGRLAVPLFAYGDSPEEFFDSTPPAPFEREVPTGNGDSVMYRCYDFGKPK